MTERVGITNYPLYWPAGWPRAKHRRRASFRDTNIYRESQALYGELERAGARRVIISSNMELRRDGLPYANQRRPEDPGVSVWFEMRRGGEWQEHVLACDRWDLVEHNARAIVKHIEALRGQERWGVGSLEQAFRGYKALPAGGAIRPWWEVLEIEHNASREAINAAFQRLAPKRHPDGGGTPELLAELLEARKQALAGELGRS